MKAKYLCLAIPICFLMASAMSGMASADIEICMEGNNYDFDIHTRVDCLFLKTNEWLPNNYSFSGSVTDGSMDVWQNVSGNRINSGIDIDRWAEFNGNGRLDIFSEYKVLGNHQSMMDSYVESDTSGYIGQNANFGYYNGGVWGMDIGATGDYRMRVTAAEVEKGLNWEFDFSASDDSGSGDLCVDHAYEQIKRKGGAKITHHTFNVGAGFVYTDTPDITNYWKANNGGTISIWEDIANCLFGMIGRIW